MANAKHSNGRLFRFLTGSPEPIVSVIFSWCAENKNCSNPVSGCCSRFSATKNHRLRTWQTLVFFPRLSSSSDLRILSSTQPSQVSPMTDFRQVWRLHAYSGGTVRDSHPVFYSPVGLLPHPQALKRNIYLHGQYTIVLEMSTEYTDKSHNFLLSFLAYFYKKTSISKRNSFSGTQANSRPHFSASLATSMQ